VPRVTSADVARASGVSRTTVSYVLNGAAKPISAPTRERVLAAARDLGYAPSAAARALRSGRSDLVLCVLPDWPIGSVLDALIEHLTEELCARGLLLLLHHGRDPRPLTELWRSVQPRVVIGLTPFSAEDQQAMARADVQVLTTGEPSELGAFQERTGALQVHHLAATGHRRIGYAAPDDDRVATFVAQRLAGARAACAELGLPPPVALEVALDATAAADAVRIWRPDGNGVVSAVAAYNDDVALAVLTGLRAHGLRVPDDVAVVGVDDTALGRLADPPLTTVSQSAEVQAHHLAAQVIAVLDGQAPPPRPEQVVHLVRRASA
jgi:DNA-binding LacI/PurR family transcriptional regulator